MKILEFDFKHTNADANDVQKIHIRPSPITLGDITIIRFKNIDKILYSS